MPSVKRTRLRRSGIRKMLRNFSSILGDPLQAPEAPVDSCSDPIFWRFPVPSAYRTRGVANYALHHTNRSPWPFAFRSQLADPNRPGFRSGAPQLTAESFLRGRWRCFAADYYGLA